MFVTLCADANRWAQLRTLYEKYSTLKTIHPDQQKLAVKIVEWIDKIDLTEDVEEKLYCRSVASTMMDDYQKHLRLRKKVHQTHSVHECKFISSRRCK